MRTPRRWRNRRASAGGTTAPAEGDPKRLEALETRIERLELALEDLQDALYRQAVAHDRDIGELRARTKPGQLARDLSEDARKRGL